MVRYRLVAIDLDETLLSFDKRISAKNKKWINRAIQAGVMVVFTTGRGRQRVGKYQKTLGLHAPIVLVNGAEVWGESGELLERSIIPINDIRALHQLAGSYDANFWGYHVDGLVGKRHWTKEMLTKDWLKFGMRHRDVHILEKIREQVQTLPAIEMTSSSSTNIEIGPKGKTKESGIRKVCAHTGITMEEVMAIGDNMNDFRLIKAAGFGVAMGNATKQLKEVADAVTDSNDKSGVAKAIKKYVL
ncbi:Cof-type HAD-IIB family hydrolase [Lentibacillus sp. N15]|uniref:Cof-type HAD-IIB family hydrolase n=1 Tax=Lentibacillus songyuanensis TaxID=3136161 RepID=UPI0031B9E8FC